MGPLLDAALSYAKVWQWPVFPLHGVRVEGTETICTCDAGPTCERKGRHPRFPEAMQQATCDEATILQWWAECPDANIGLPTGAASGIVALEIAPEDGALAIDDALSAGHDLPTVPWLDTSGGALHLFKAPDEPIKSRIPLDRGLYLRGDGSFVMLEPSRGADGSECRFRHGAGPGMVAPVPLPPWILDKAARRQPSDASPPPGGGLIKLYSTRDIFEMVLPEADWICRPLGMCLGDRPLAIIGPSGSGKTWIVQALALALVGGRPAWGNPAFVPIRPLRLIHLDYEIGLRIALQRYRELARTMGLDYSHEIENRLWYGEHPDLYLTDDGAEEKLEQATNGADVVIVDAFRGATPGADENDSRVRQFVDICTRVSRRSPLLFILLHHTGKSSGEGGEARYAARGSSGLVDAFGTVFLISGDHDEPKLVTNTKMAAGADSFVEPFRLDFRRVELPDGSGRPMAIVYMSEDEAEEAAERNEKKDWIREQKKILAAVQRSPGVTLTGLFAAVKGNRRKFDKVRDWLLKIGFIENKGSDTRHKYELGEVGRAWLDKDPGGSRPSGDARTGEAESDPEPDTQREPDPGPE